MRAKRHRAGRSSSTRADPPKFLSVVPIAAIAVYTLAAAPCMALECPVSQPARTSGAIQESPAQISELSQVLASGDLANRIPVFVRALHSRHPNAPTGDLVNYLVTAYCPTINKLTGLSDSEKQAKLDAFASQVTQAAY